MKKHKIIPLEKIDFYSLIEKLNSYVKSFDYCVYGKGSSDDATLETACFIDFYPEITDDDEEIFPATVIDQSLDFWFRDELLEDVVFNALKQKPSASPEEILQAIKYYNHHDSFYNFGNPEK